MPPDHQIVDEIFRHCRQIILHFLIYSCMYGGIAVKTILLYFQLEIARFTYVELILSAGLVLDVIRLHFFSLNFDGCC